MTRKTALLEAIRIIESVDIEQEFRDLIVEKLQHCVRDLPFCKWSKESIFDAFDQFVEEHHRNIHIHDMDCYGLPPRSAIRREFDMSGAEFRDKYYPPTPVVRKTWDESRNQKLIEDFGNEYLRCGAYSKLQYDRLRNSEMPNSNTILRRTGIARWADLMRIAKIPGYRYGCGARKEPLKLTYHSDVLDKLSAIDKYEELMQAGISSANLQTMLDNAEEHIYSVENY